MTSPLSKAIHRLIGLQGSNGAWESEVVWCPVITAQMVILHAITGTPITTERSQLIRRQFERTRRPDGGWGLHPESNSYLFVTTLVYVAARLLGELPTSPLLREPAEWLARHPDGLAGLPTWGRFWLSLIGLYDRRRLTSCPPELFLLPDWMPIAPNRFYCHTRYIYLGMAYLSGRAFTADLGSIGNALGRELAAFAGVPRRSRNAIAATDQYVRPGLLLRSVYRVMAALGPIWRRVPGASALRRRALDRCLRRIRSEQRASDFQSLSPVNGILNTLALYANAPDDGDTYASLAGLEVWKWCDDEDGTRYAGARSTTWDTAFALQVLSGNGEFGPETTAALRSGYASLAALQVTETPGNLDEGRQSPVGGWCFGTNAHAWPVSDCTAEAVVALLQCHRLPGLIPETERIPSRRLAGAMRFLLERQNADGGFATYERRRGGRQLERLNPSEMFGQCMTELSYIECTASSIRALHDIGELPAGTFSPADQARCRPAVARGIEFLLRQQRADGAWPGFWGINFIYGTYFAVSALREVELAIHHPSICRAIEWLHSIQRADGGWGEHFSGCLTGTYVPSPQSLVISTSWAVLALMRAEGLISTAAQRGLNWLAAKQLPNGDWPRDSVNGVFFGTAMLDYRLYNTYFPAWALREAHGRNRALPAALASSV